MQGLEAQANERGASKASAETADSLSKHPRNDPFATKGTAKSIRLSIGGNVSIPGAAHPEVVGGIWAGSGDLTGPAGREHGVAAGDGRAPRVGCERRLRDHPQLRDARAQAGGP